ncbi:hypothetical protein [Paracoccus versutus]|uniref:hypothetical protein n=1 Tax=Paracoccus versutus TaxID=34007 RepID=UPI00403C0CDB
MMELEVGTASFFTFKPPVISDASMPQRATSHVAGGLLEQMANIGSYRRAVAPAASNFALGFVDSMEPQDATEALLLAQMAAIHQATGEARILGDAAGEVAEAPFDRLGLAVGRRSPVDLDAQRGQHAQRVVVAHLEAEPGRGAAHQPFVGEFVPVVEKAMLRDAPGLDQLAEGGQAPLPPSGRC